ncbi:DUF4974 domain-containing protein [Hymenobacter sediminis]|uniref:FecR family protein n=1 Tax=Hymenobacter sediminis TaxID=2218621 RepID=UPI000DA66C33|nr:FecR domain-containing protein [Hymenobacter sediminis]RPD48033.1 DUF4974 domain-containing protein [Hymenobacter sediminis]
MNQAYLLHLLQRYQQGECTPEEARVVEQWYELLGHEQPPLMLAATEREQLRALLWQNIEAQTQQLAVSPSAGRPWYAGAARWAAAAALALGLGVGAQQILTRQSAPPVAVKPSVHQASGWRTYVNATTQPQTVRLTDGSMVQVSPQGQLKYPARFATQHRTVYLKGEAFFTIAHDKAHPFRVYTQEVVTTVLGTSFLVRAPEGTAPVVVKVRTGRVQVNPLREPAATPAARRSIVVLPNQQAVYLPARHELQRELVAQPVQLAAQSFVFDDRPVAEVLDALQKAYGIAIEYDSKALRNCTVTLNLQNESLYGKLDVLSKALGASYTASETHLIFRSPGCAAR